MSSNVAGDEQAFASADDDDKVAPSRGRDRPSVGAYAQVAALLHESRRQAPDRLGSFLARRVTAFGMRELSVYVTDFEQRRLVPIAGSAATASIDMDDSSGGRSFTTAAQVDKPTAGGVRLWSVVVDGAARLGVISVTMSEVHDEDRSLADSLAGVVAAPLVTRGQCTDAYTALRRSQKFSLAAEMQWDLLPPLSLDSGRVSLAGLIQPAYDVGGDSFDYAVNGDVLDFAVFDAMGHGLRSALRTLVYVGRPDDGQRCVQDVLSHPLLIEHLAREALAFLDEGDQKVFGPDVVVSLAARNLCGDLGDHLGRPGREANLGREVRFCHLTRVEGRDRRAGRAHGRDPGPLQPAAVRVTPNVPSRWPRRHATRHLSRFVMPGSGPLRVSYAPPAASDTVIRRRRYVMSLTGDFAKLWGQRWRCVVRGRFADARDRRNSGAVETVS